MVLANARKTGTVVCWCCWEIRNNTREFAWYSIFNWCYWDWFTVWLNSKIPRTNYNIQMGDQHFENLTVYLIPLLNENTECFFAKHWTMTWYRRFIWKRSTIKDKWYRALITNSMIGCWIISTTMFHVLCIFRFYFIFISSHFLSYEGIL